MPRPTEAGGVSLRRRIDALIQASHPFPILMVVSLTLLTGVVSADGHPRVGRLLVASTAMLFSQVAIGWSNDYLDREHDARYQPQKPIPAGLVPAAALPPLVVLALICTAALGLTLGFDALGLLVAGTACGLIYNLFLKETPLSWLGYMGGFALLPAFVWSATGVYRADFIWLYALGSPLAIAAHVANSLPDIESDEAAGAAGLVPLLGRSRSLVLLFACLLAPVVGIAGTLLWVDYAEALLAGTVVAYLALVLVARVTYSDEPFPPAARRGFRIVAPAAVLLVTGWLAAV